VKNEKHIDDITILMATMDELVTEFQCSLYVFDQPSHQFLARTFPKTLLLRPACAANHGRRVICSITANNVLPFHARQLHKRQFALTLAKGEPLSKLVRTKSLDPALNLYPCRRFLDFVVHCSPSSFEERTRTPNCLPRNGCPLGVFSTGVSSGCS
jgi:hypothetical protein